MIKLSTQTLEVLKNFSTINQNLVVKSGEPLSTISEAKNIIAIAPITENFDSDFGIYDLSEFIGIFNLVGDPELTFSTDAVQFSSGRSKASYRFADQSILTTPKSAVKMPASDLTITITADNLAQVRKAASVIGHSIVSVRGSGGNVALSVVDPKNSASNSFSITIDENNSQTADFDLQFLIANLKVLPGDYTVEISSKLISHWTAAGSFTPVQYYIALEKSSSWSI